jgi:hypothetical protein
VEINEKVYLFGIFCMFRTSTKSVENSEDIMSISILGFLSNRCCVLGLSALQDALDRNVNDLQYSFMPVTASLLRFFISN